MAEKVLAHFEKKLRHKVSLRARYSGCALTAGMSRKAKLKSLKARTLHFSNRFARWSSSSKIKSRWARWLPSLSRFALVLFIALSFKTKSLHFHSKLVWQLTIGFAQVLNVIDFDQLKIENKQFLEKIEERNNELITLKLTTGQHWFARKL